MTVEPGIYLRPRRDPYRGPRHRPRRRAGDPHDVHEGSRRRWLIAPPLSCDFHELCAVQGVMAVARVIAVALVALAAAGCGAAEHNSAPGGPTSTVRVREVHVPSRSSSRARSPMCGRPARSRHCSRQDDLRLELPVGSSRARSGTAPATGTAATSILRLIAAPPEWSSAMAGRRSRPSVSIRGGRASSRSAGRNGLSQDGRPRHQRPAKCSVVCDRRTIRSTSTRQGVHRPAGALAGRHTIAFVRLRRSRVRRRLVVPTTGGNPVLVRRVKEPNAYIGGLVWSPDGSRLLSSEGSGLFLLRAHAPAHARFVVSDAGSPSFSPDGTQIAYEHLVGQRSDVWVYNIANGKKRAVTRNGLSIAPVWGTPGIAFSRGTGRGAHYEVWIVQAPGERAHRLTSTRSGLVQVAWSGDGSRLLAQNPVKGSDAALVSP